VNTFILKTSELTHKSINNRAHVDADRPNQTYVDLGVVKPIHKCLEGRHFISCVLKIMYLFTMNGKWHSGSNVNQKCNLRRRRLFG